MIRLLFICSFLGISLSLTCQVYHNRYKEEIFGSFTKTSNQVYSTADPRPKPIGWILTIFGYRIVDNEATSNTTNINLTYDLYEPTGDTIAKRPLVVLCFGGGFVAGEKGYWSMQLLAQSLSKRGYVVASIDYRLGMYISDSIYSARAVYRGVQDSYAAISYFRANAATLRIDPDQIYIGGHSAGAFVAIHNLYMDDDVAERPQGTYAYGNAANQGGLLQTSEHNAFSGRANGGFSMAGAVGNPSFIGAGDVGMALFHSSDDPTVNINYDIPFKQYESYGLQLPKVYGSDLIEDRFQTLGIDYTYHLYTNRGHGVHEAVGNVLYPDIVPAISDWFLHRHLAPAPSFIMGPQDVCISQGTGQYHASYASFQHYAWTVSGGSIVSGQGTESVSIAWDNSPGEQALSYVPYTHNHTEGDTVSLQINLANSFDNAWVSDQSGSWQDASSWSKNRIPLACDVVTLTDSLPEIDVFINSGDTIVVKELYIAEGVNLQLSNNSTILVRP